MEENNNIHHDKILNLQLKKLKDESLHGTKETTSKSTENDSGLKPTLSQAMMNSHLLQALPKYIFQSDHESLKSVNNILKEVKEQQNRDDRIGNIGNIGGGEVSEYPIEHYEHQQHAIERHMSIKYLNFFLIFFFFLFKLQFYLKQQKNLIVKIRLLNLKN